MSVSIEDRLTALESRLEKLDSQVSQAIHGLLEISKLSSKRVESALTKIHDRLYDLESDVETLADEDD